MGNCKFCGQVTRNILMLRADELHGSHICDLCLKNKTLNLKCLGCDKKTEKIKKYPFALDTLSVEVLFSSCSNTCTASIDKSLSYFLKNMLMLERPKCANCLKSDIKLKLCPCKEIYFCGSECQRAKWGDHKIECKYFLEGKIKTNREFIKCSVCSLYLNMNIFSILFENNKYKIICGMCSHSLNTKIEDTCSKCNKNIKLFKAANLTKDNDNKIIVLFEKNCETKCTTLDLATHIKNIKEKYPHVL